MACSLPSPPQLDPTIDKDAKTMVSTPDTNSFWTPSAPAPFHHALPWLNCLRLSFYYTRRRCDRALSWAFTEPIRHGKKAALVRVRGNERSGRNEWRDIKTDWGGAGEGQTGGHTRQEEVLSLKFKWASWVSKDTGLFPSSVSFSLSLPPLPPPRVSFLSLSLSDFIASY